MRRSWAGIVVVVGVGIAVVLGGAGCGGSAKHEPEAADKETAKEGAGHGEAEAVVTVRVEPARVGTVTETAEGLGRCEALPDQIATLTPAVEGHVEALLVKQGDSVSKGQPIVELDKSVADADLAEKSATRDGLRASLVLLKSLPRLEEQRPQELAVDQAKIAVDRAQAVMDKLKPLQARNEISGQQLFDATKAYDAAVLMQKSAEAQRRVQMMGPRPEAVAEAEARIKTADGLVAFSQAHLNFHTIHSPIDGVLDSLTCHPGQTIAVGAPIGDVVDARRVHAAVWLPPRVAQAVHKGQKAKVYPTDDRPKPEPHDATKAEDHPAKPGGDEPKAEAHEPKAEEAGMEGTVDFVGRVTDPQTGNLSVLILVDNESGRLALGQTLEVSVATVAREGVLQVPAAAIWDSGEGSVLGVVREGKAVMLHPEVGPPHDGWVPVAGTDLKPGEAVIVEGAYNLPEGTPVKVEGAKEVAHAEATKDAAPAAPAEAGR